MTIEILSDLALEYLVFDKISKSSDDLHLKE